MQHAYGAKPPAARKKKKAFIGFKSNEGHKIIPIRLKLRDAIPPPTLFPPNSWILRAVQHLRQFLLDLEQPVGAHFHRRLIDLAIRRPVGGASVHVP
jgi:hypothetical protein